MPATDPFLQAQAPVLVLAPHPDDESLGCGAMLARRWSAGQSAHVACLTDGAASHPRSRSHPPGRLSSLRRAELAEAVRRLGGDPARDVTWLGFPDAALHCLHGPGCDLAGTIAGLAARIGARTLVAASPEDPHCDHVACGRAARTARALRPELRLYFYPIWSRWRDRGLAPDGAADGTLSLDLPAWRERKARAIGAHRSQYGEVIRDDPEGFRMPRGFAEFFAHTPEIYVEAAR
jgi:LmbE family N-acetylglucosaminyl deacetylase